LSNLTVTTLSGKETNANTVAIAAGHMLSTPKLYSPGSVVQVQTIRSDSRVTMTAGASGSFTNISQLAITITPKFNNSKLVMQWVINGEIQHDAVFLVIKNGALITTAGETSYNSEAGNTNWSGMSASDYDQNQDSTPATYNLQYFGTTTSTSAVTFSPAVKTSNTATATFSLNRTIGSSGGDNHENMVSTGIIWEIAQ